MFITSIFFINTLFYLRKFRGENKDSKNNWFDAATHNIITHTCHKVSFSYKYIFF